MKNGHANFLRNLSISTKQSSLAVSTATNCKNAELKLERINQIVIFQTNQLKFRIAKITKEKTKTKTNKQT